MLDKTAENRIVVSTDKEVLDIIGRATQQEVKRTQQYDNYSLVKKVRFKSSKPLTTSCDEAKYKKVTRVKKFLGIKVKEYECYSDGIDDISLTTIKELKDEHRLMEREGVLYVQAQVTIVWLDKVIEYIYFNNDQEALQFYNSIINKIEDGKVNIK